MGILGGLLGMFGCRQSTRPQTAGVGRMEDWKVGQPRAGMTNSHTAIVNTSSITH